jgi:hypothetical protein
MNHAGFLQVVPNSFISTEQIRCVKQITTSMPMDKIWHEFHHAKWMRGQKNIKDPEISELIKLALYAYEIKTTLIPSFDLASFEFIPNAGSTSKKAGEKAVLNRLLALYKYDVLMYILNLPTYVDPSNS